MLPYWIEIHPAASHGLKCLPTRYSENMRGVGRSFSYTADDVDIISGDELIHFLADVVSKNGKLLLNIGPKPDGSIPEEQAGPIRELSRWLSIHGAAIYGTRPWRQPSDASREGNKLTDTTDKERHRCVMVDQAYGCATVLMLPNEVQVDAAVPAPAAISILGRPDGVRWTQQGKDPQLVFTLFSAIRGSSAGAARCAAPHPEGAIPHSPLGIRQPRENGA